MPMSKMISVMSWCLLALLFSVSITGAQVERFNQLTYPPLSELVIPEPTRVTLENGMMVLLLEDHELPLVSVTAQIRTGSRLEP